MKALVLQGGRLKLEDRPVPEPGPDEALVKVLLAGICSTDLQLRAGYMDFEGVPGHEFVGRLESGQTVVGEINAACEACEEPRHCPHRTVLGILGRDGAFAEYLTLPTRNLHPVKMPEDRAVFVEPVAAAFEIPAQLEVRGKRVLVLGAGKLGTLCAGVLRLSGADVTLLGRDGDPNGRGADIVVEATGDPEGFPRALELVRPMGTVVLKSTCAAGRPLNLAPVVIDEITVVGSRCGPFKPAIGTLTRGDLKPEETIAARFPLDQYERAFKAAEHPDDPARRKILLTP